MLDPISLVQPEREPRDLSSWASLLHNTGTSLYPRSGPSITHLRTRGQLTLQGCQGDFQLYLGAHKPGEDQSPIGLMFREHKASGSYLWAHLRPTILDCLLQWTHVWVRTKIFQEQSFAELPCFYTAPVSQLEKRHLFLWLDAASCQGVWLGKSSRSYMVAATPPLSTQLITCTAA